MALTKIKTGGIADNAITDAKVADAITVTGAQTGITQVGTLTTLTVDNVIINGTTIGHTGDTDLLTFASSKLTVAGDVKVDGGNALLLREDDTYINSPSSDRIDFRTSGTVALYIDSSQNATFAGTITAGSTSKFTGSGDTLTLESTNSGTGGAQLNLNHVGGSQADGDSVGRILFNGQDSNDNSVTYARIDGIAEDVTDGSENGALNFDTRTSNSAFETKMRITSGGNVGIGTVAPTNVLELEFDDGSNVYEAGNVADNSASGILITNTGSSVGRGGMLKFASKDGDNMTAIVHTQEGNDSASLRFFTESGGTLAERMLIDHDGTFTFKNTSARWNFYADSDTDIVQYFAGHDTSDAIRIAASVAVATTAASNACNGELIFATATGNTNTERMRIKSDGKVGVGTTSPGDYSTSGDDFVVKGSDHTGISIVSPTNKSGNIMFADGTSGDAQYKGFIQYDHGNNLTDVMVIGTNGSEKMRITSGGNVLIAKTSTGFGNVGFEVDSGGRIGVKTNGSEAIYVNRSQDGTLIEFASADTAEGTISVSGSTVSYNGFSGSHESSGIPTDTAIGTVVSTIDELDVYPNTDYKTGEAHNKAGETRADHAKIKVSDSVGDKRVYGVLASFNEDNKPIVASVGIGSVKVTGACQGGDLLESNGDGTAKVQSDDIIRSKTIGKVTIGDSDTSVKLVSCVLYCG